MPLVAGIRLGRAARSAGLLLTSRQGFTHRPRSSVSGLSGGRTWWAHFEFTRMNIGPTILRKKIEDDSDARAFVGRRNEEGEPR